MMKKIAPKNITVTNNKFNQLLVFLFIINFLSLNTYGQNFTEILKMVASDRGSLDYFGHSVSISGNYAIIGSKLDGEDTSGINTLSGAGSAYIFEKDGSGNWSQVQKIVASDRGVGDIFGHAVSISGNYAVIGAPTDDEDTSGGIFLPVIDVGSAYIFERDSSGNWNEVQRILASDMGMNDNFGWSAAISGNHIIVGAYWDDEDASNMNYASKSGSAYIFERDSSGNWSEVQKIVASDRDADDLFGLPVSISGNYAIVGAHQEDEDTSGTNTLSRAGAAYIFERDGGGNWNEVQKIVPSDRAVDDMFGNAISISGNYAIVSAHNDSEDAAGLNTLQWAGSAYIFERDGGGSWNEVQKIVASDRAAQDKFSQSVAISGNYAIVGAWQEDEDVAGVNTLFEAGAAYIFKRDGGGNWNELKKIVASDRATSDYFGYSVAISNQNTLVTAILEDEDAFGGNTISNSGSVYLFEGICAVDASVSIASSTLTANLSGATYQWIDCNNANLPILGETGQSFTAVSSGSYAVIVHYGGCSDTSSCYPVMCTIDTSVSIAASTLTANLAGVTYQWIDCDNNNLPIPSETGQSFTALSNGSYAVIVSNGSCSDTSSCFSLIVVGIKKHHTQTLKIYPNPSTGLLNIELSGSINNSYQLEIINSIGQSIKELKLINLITTVNLENIAAGLYFVQVKTDQGIERIPFVIN